jgi:hypothetical protein
VGRLGLDAVNFLDDEWMDLFFHDGGMFAGHAIIVRIEDSGDPGEVQLFG